MLVGSYDRFGFVDFNIVDQLMGKSYRSPRILGAFNESFIPFSERFKIIITFICSLKLVLVWLQTPS